MKNENDDFEFSDDHLVGGAIGAAAALAVLMFGIFALIASAGC